MLELVQNLELRVRNDQNNELLAQFRSIDSVPMMTTSLESLERCATIVYTRASFGSQKYDLFQKAMKGIHNLCIHLEGHFATEDNVFSTKGKGVIRDLVAMRTKGAPKTQNCRGRKRQSDQDGIEAEQDTLIVKVEAKSSNDF
ncbi:hypothetical protein AHAS_Ahas01G0108900 [Arachis hypogaea]